MSGFSLAVTLVAVLLLGYGMGVVVNYFADVLPQTRRLSPVRCLHCQNPYPLLQYILLRPCLECGTRRSLRARVVQGILPLLTLALWVWPPPGRVPISVAWGLLLFFSVVFVIDWEYRVVLYQVSGVGALLGAGIGAWLNGWQTTFLGGGLGFGIMLALYYLGELFVRWAAHRRGLETDEVALGFGDVTLSGVLGLMLGWPRIGIGLLFAILLGGIVSGLYLVGLLVSKRYQPFAALPYTPFLLVAAAILMYLA
ncbi:prepilin peptidase [uncultured Thermanaerothrix sp.]|uniref:prepilin peptidase n=1 Tax=uncultured Thermanaerothrix sp. TaxID=1195149 RepID=UPI002620DFF2|nr:prepilin peptidase [uncultured Thermanaerothrix sp.]